MVEFVFGVEVQGQECIVFTTELKVVVGFQVRQVFVLFEEMKDGRPLVLTVVREVNVQNDFQEEDLAVAILERSTDADEERQHRDGTLTLPDPIEKVILIGVQDGLAQRADVQKADEFGEGAFQFVVVGHFALHGERFEVVEKIDQCQAVLVLRVLVLGID